MKRIKSFAMIVAIMVLGLCGSAFAVSLTVGSGNYYVSVGDNDYLPYAYGAGYQPQMINFQVALGDYGQWVPMQPFGNVWQPYVAQGWRPFTQGHWVYTQFGPTWVGYEPWAWAGYHYGNWVFSQQLGWVMVPSNQYTPGNVAWAQGYNSIGWMPMPPTGYDYSRGYLAYVGPQNQFTIGSSDFSVAVGVGGGGYYQGGYGPSYSQYYNQNYVGISGQLWTFVEPNYFNADNYADYYIGGNYTQQLFSQQMVRVSSRPLDRVVVERIVGQSVPVRQVQVRDVNFDGRQARMVTVQGEEQDVRKNANRTVREVIAPAFAEKGRSFKGPQAKAQAGLNKTLNQGETNAKVETVDSDQLVQQARQMKQQQEERRAQANQRKIQETDTAVKQGKIRRPNTPPGQLKKEEDTRQRNSQVNPNEPNQQPDINRNRPDVPNDRENNGQVNKPGNTNEDQQNTSHENRPSDRRTNENMNRPPKPTEDQQNKNHPNDNSNQPPDRRVTPPDHSNMQPDSDQKQNQRDENAVKDNKDNTDKNANAKDQSNKDKSKKTKNNKDKDKKNNPDNSDQPPPPER